MYLITLTKSVRNKLKRHPETLVLICDVLRQIPGQDYDYMYCYTDV